MIDIVDFLKTIWTWIGDDDYMSIFDLILGQMYTTLKSSLLDDAKVIKLS